MIYPRLQKFRNVHRGERAFIVGNGKSLLKTPLEKLTSDCSFAMNKISLIYSQTTWRPNYYVCVASEFEDVTSRKVFMDAILYPGTISFVNKLNWSDNPYDHVFPMNCDGKDVTEYEEIPGIECWSNDISRRVSKFASSILTVFQIAFYMGFYKLYLVGTDIDIVPHDYTSDEPDPNHFDPGYQAIPFSPEVAVQNFLAAHRITIYWAEKLGIKIFNATVGGKLELYPRVKLDDIL